MRHVSLADQPCPIARTLDIVGEWWTLLVVRDALLGARRFEDFKNGGISDNILAARLKRLTEAGIFKRKVYQTRPTRFEYVLTEKGHALAPAILALRTWGQRFARGPDRSQIRHENCGHELSIALYCPECARPIDRNEVAVSSEKYSTNATRVSA